MAESMEEEMPEELIPLEEDLKCPVCREIFSDPVLLLCTHSFCRECLQKSVQYKKECPVCRDVFEESQAISNRALSNACETFLKYPHCRPTQGCVAEDTCKLHLKPLALYCEKDEEPVCVDCVLLHNTHRLWPVNEGTKICKVTRDHPFQSVLFHGSYSKTFLPNNLLFTSFTILMTSTG